MKLYFIVTIVFIGNLCAAPDDGRFISCKKFIPELPKDIDHGYTDEEYNDGLKKFYAIKDNAEFWSITYKSDGLVISGYIVQPKGLDNPLEAKNKPKKLYPCIIYNRGGGGNFGSINAVHMDSLYSFVKQGFIVVASNYRGTWNSEGKDDFGGADVNDVLNITTLARNLKTIDPNNIFMVGRSRGPMQVLLSVKKDPHINAVALIAGVYDHFKLIAQRPAFGPVFYEGDCSIPEFKSMDEQLIRKALEDRSAIFWPEKITTPVLLIHGGSDWRVDFVQSLSFAKALQKYNKEYKLIIYGNDDHDLTKNKEEMIQEIVNWFEKFKK